jgi:glycosyltransferase involved in cell wall biosynthesis
MDGKLLWFVPRWLLPAEDGARVATVSLLRGLTALDVSIDLIAVIDPSERPAVDVDQARRELGVDRVFVLEREAKSLGSAAFYLKLLRSFVRQPLTPLTAWSYASDPAVNGLAAHMRAHPNAYRAVVYEGLHVAAHSLARGRYNRPTAFRRLPLVYRAHNYETDIWRRKAELTHNPVTRAFFRHQAERMHAFESSLAAACDYVAAVSPQDLSLFERDVPDLRGGCVPIGYDFGDRAPEKPFEAPELIFIGRLDWPPNREGLRWFLEQVWPEVRTKRSDMRLTIAGSGDSRWLEGIDLGVNARFVGRVPVVADLYRTAAISLAPVFYGSGTRVKVIEASRFATATLGTEIGVEGVGLTPDESYLRAETREQWIDALCQLELERVRRVGQAAYACVREAFDAGRVASKFKATLEALSR